MTTFDKSLTSITELVVADHELIIRERERSSGARNVHSLEDYTLHDLVRVTDVAQQMGYSVELITYGDQTYWGLID